MFGLQTAKQFQSNDQKYQDEMKDNSVSGIKDKTQKLVKFQIKGDKVIEANFTHWQEPENHIRVQQMSSTASTMTGRVTNTKSHSNDSDNSGNQCAQEATCKRKRRVMMTLKFFAHTQMETTKNEYADGIRNRESYYYLNASVQQTTQALDIFMEGQEQTETLKLLTDL